MKSILKWLLIIGGVLVVLLIAAVIIVPQMIDVNKFKPEIEQKVAQVTGRNFSIGDDIDLSIFPWVGVKVTNVALGNPEGFTEKQMAAIEQFEVRLKVLPLISRRIEVKTFVVDGPQIVLEKLKDGRVNWVMTGAKKKPEKKADQEAPAKGLPIKDLQVAKFAVTNGTLIYRDKTASLEKQVTDLNLVLDNVSLDQPVAFSFDAKLDQKPVSLRGTAGPIGLTPGKGTMALDLSADLLDTVKMTVKGTLTDPASAPAFDLALDVAPFSARKLLAALNIPLPVAPRDPKVLEKLALKVTAKGTPTSVGLSGGQFSLDDSTLDFMAKASEFNRPNLAFDLKLDQIDLDRYLPEPKEKTAPASAGHKQNQPEKKPDYKPLRKLILDGRLKVGQLKASNATVTDINVHLMANNGVITVDPMDLKLYDGFVDSAVIVNVQKASPRTAVKLLADKIQAGPLIKDALDKELIEGQMQASLDLGLAGDTPEEIKQTLTGKGQVLFNDGAIIGIDLASSVRNVKSKLGMGEKPTEKPRTDFAELKLPFVSKRGDVNINGTSLVSPLLRIFVSGDVVLPKEGLDLRIEPKFVATLKGQGDTEQRSGLMVPLLITGTFTSPKIRPDLKGMIGGGKLDADSIKKKVLGGKTQLKGGVKEQKKVIEKQIKSLIPGFGD
jgi:AsmA protein